MSFCWGPDSVTHFERDGAAVCGRTAALSFDTADRTAVTCKRCLKSLASRDRAFQRKARAGIKRGQGPLPFSVECASEERALRLLRGRAMYRARVVGSVAAARAIAAEEGRAS